MNTFELTNPELAGQGMSIDITPHPSLLPKTGQVGYSIEEAGAELVDNSIDARQGDTVDITVMLGGIGDEKDAQYLDVEDNGTGMTPEQAKNAVVLGLSNKKAQDIGEFGMGLKTACTFLGGRFVVETATEDDPDATLIVYDEEEFKRREKWELTAYRKPKRFAHGTRIHIERMHVNLTGRGRGASEGNKPVQRLRKLLARQHRLRLKSGEVRIKVNDLTVEPHTPEYDPQWEPVLTRFDFTTKSGKRVHGIVGYAKTMQGKGEEFGLDLIRHGRIVKEYEKLGAIASHPSWRNVYGVVYLDDFPVTNNKSDFIRDSDDWMELEEKMADVTKALGTAISKWYNTGPSAKSNKDIQHLYKLVRETVDGREVIKWVLPQDEETPTRLEDDDEGPSGLNLADLFGDDGNDTNGNDAGAGTKSGADNTPAGGGTGTEGGLGISTTPTNGAAPGPGGFHYAPPAAHNGLFEGTLGGLRFRHRTAHDGPSARDFTSETIEEEGGTVLDIVSNLDYHTSPEVRSLFWFKRNVVAAVVGYLVLTGKADCTESDSLASALLLDLLA